MSALQWEEGMVDDRRNPTLDAVAFAAIVRIVLRYMVRCAQVFRFVARIAVRRQSRVDSRRRVALIAIEPAMSARKREKSMVEDRRRPSRRIVASLAIGYPPVRQMIGLDSLLQVGLVAKFALERCTKELTRSGGFVAAFAGRDSMCSHQRESRVCMFADQSDGIP